MCYLFDFILCALLMAAVSAVFLVIDCRPQKENTYVILQGLPAAELFILRFCSLLSSTNVIHLKKSMTLLLKIVHSCWCDRFLTGPFFFECHKDESALLRLGRRLAN